MTPRMFFLFESVGFRWTSEEKEEEEEEMNEIDADRVSPPEKQRKIYYWRERETAKLEQNAFKEKLDFF